MKKLLIATLATLTLGTTSIIADDDSGLYLGLAYASTNIDITIDGLSDENQDILDSATDSAVLLVGYDFNNYFGIESRYYANLSSLAFEYELGNTPLSGKYKAESLAFYAKPQYNLGLITIYALAGVTFNDYTVSNLSGAQEDDALFSWGAGAKFNVTQSLGLFVDYTDLGESTDFTKTTLSSWNLGISYRF